MEPLDRPPAELREPTTDLSFDRSNHAPAGTRYRNFARHSSTAAVLLALILGGLGAHRFYMGQIALGVIYLVFCWTFIPAILGFFEMFLMSGRVDRHNDQVAMELAAKMKILAGAGSPSPALTVG